MKVDRLVSMIMILLEKRRVGAEEPAAMFEVSPRDCPKPTLELNELLEALQTDIRLRVHASVLDRVLDFCLPERVTPDGAEHYLVDYPFIERDYYYDMLLSLGDKCECLAPERVRDELRRRIRRMAHIYGE